MTTSRKKILILGPRFSNKGNVGGVVVLFEDFIDSCKKNKLCFKVIDINKTNYRNSFIAFLTIFLLFLKNLKKFDHVSLHGTENDFKILAPIIVLFSKLNKREVSLRKFAGSFYTVYKNSNFIVKNIIKHSLRNSDFIFFETKYLVEKFKNFNSEIYWWPNSRNKSSYRVGKEFKKKFVFISQIKESKGINEIIDAAIRLDDTFTFDFYGPILDDDFIKKVESLSNVDYKGVLQPTNVISTLKKYNVLILPTYHNGEGYPGIIIEAFSVGLPVISTYWKSIPELISHNRNGLLVPIKDSDSLYNSIVFFDNKKYNQFSKYALNCFDEFDSKKINLNFFKAISVF